MRKFSKGEKVILVQCIIESDIKRLSLEETAIFIKQKIGKDISINYISELRQNIRKRGRRYIGDLDKNRDTYVSEYLTLIEGAKFSEGELYKLALDSNTPIQEKIAVHRELGKYKVIIAQLMDAIPIVGGLQKVEVFDNDNDSNENRKTPDDQILESEQYM